MKKYKTTEELIKELKDHWFNLWFEILKYLMK